MGSMKLIKYGARLNGFLTATNSKEDSLNYRQDVE